MFFAIGVMDHSVLGNIVVLLAASVVAVVLFRLFNLPSILAYLFVGVAIGPHALGLIPNDNSIRALGEFGVVFLLFTLGLEFSLPQLVSLKKEVFALGGAQVAGTTVAVGLGAWMAGMSPAGAFVLGGVFAMSSTAIVTKQLTEQLELDSRHGRMSVGMLLFQDIAVVPFLIVIAALATGQGESLAQDLAKALGIGTLVVLAMLATGYWVLRPLFHRIASLHSAELFTLSALLLALAASWLTSISGLSLALGAFLSGMMLGETKFRHQIEADIRPFRDVLLGLFFVTIGMMVDPHVLPQIWPWVVLGVVALLGFKMLSIAGLGLVFDTPMGVAVRTALVMSHGGEFSLALLMLALSYGMFTPMLTQVAVVIIVLSMALAPLMIRHNGRIAKRLCADSYSRNRQAIVDAVAAENRGLSGHVVICGYGRTGQNIARLLEQEGFTYTALDLDAARVREARAAGDHVGYGDSTHIDILRAAGLESAKALVISHNDVYSAEKTVTQARNLCPDIPILVRTTNDSNLDRLQRAGATEVVPETLEAALMLGAHLFVILEVPVSRIVRRVQMARTDRYRMLREFFHGQEAEAIDQPEATLERLHSLTLDHGAHAVGKTVGALKLDEIGVSLTAIQRHGQRITHPQPDFRLSDGDVLILYASPEALERAEWLLLKG